MIGGGENDTSGCHLAGFSEDVAFARHFVATRPLPTLPPCGVLLVLATPVKNYLKWWEILLAVYPLVGGKIDYINNYRIVANFVQASASLPELQYVK